MGKRLLYLIAHCLAVISPCSGEHTQVEISGCLLEVEVADTSETRAIGLSGRAELSEGTGMLFIYQHPHQISFWMKNTLIPLSIGFFDANRVLLQIEEMDPPTPGLKKIPIYAAKKPALYAIEVPQGWFERNQVRPGAIFNFVEPGQ